MGSKNIEVLMWFEPMTIAILLQTLEKLFLYSVCLNWSPAHRHRTGGKLGLGRKYPVWESSSQVGWSPCQDAQHMPTQDTVLWWTGKVQGFTGWAEKALQGHPQGLTEELWHWPWHLGNPVQDHPAWWSHNNISDTSYIMSRVGMQRPREGVSTASQGLPP